MQPADVVVVGQIARDLVLLAEEVPTPGTSTAVRQRREMLGGKGANQAVALAQLGVRAPSSSAAPTLWRRGGWPPPQLRYRSANSVAARTSQQGLHAQLDALLNPHL